MYFIILLSKLLLGKKIIASSHKMFIIIEIFVKQIDLFRLGTYLLDLVKKIGFFNWNIWLKNYIIKHFVI